jgi:RNA polymerase sigma factor (sigma-70 family)
VHSESRNQASKAQIAFDVGERLRRGDETVLDDILRAYGSIIAAGLRSRYAVLNWHDVEDVLAIALHQLWKYRQKYDPAKASLKALFCRIADNVAKKLFRLGWQRLRQEEVELDTKTEAACRPRSDSDSAKTSKLSNDVQQVLAKLPAAYRHIVLADAYAGGRVANSDLLAEELEIPTGTVRVYRSRAISAIRLEMRKRGYEVP